MPEEHSDEIDKAIWRMSRRGFDVRCIMSNLKYCELIVSRKYINMAIKRGTVQMKDNPSPMEEVPVEEEDEDAEDSPEKLEAETTESMSRIVSGDEQDEETTPAEISQPEVDNKIAEEPKGMLLTITTVPENEAKKPRRIKTTDELIEKLQEDFRMYPETKVKERAAKFGIAVGTLCQIKHNILKMPKESGRTWKSTPQMVEAVASDMHEFPNLKVKERAQKFGISVGTLCRIMHDILELPKRTVTRSVFPRGARSSALPRTIAPPAQVDMLEETVESNSNRARKRKKAEPEQKAQTSAASSPSKMKNITQMCQVQLKGDGGTQMLVLTFDPETAAQFSSEGMGLQLAGNDEIIWMVNSPSEVRDEDQATLEGVIETEASSE